ncbi:TylF/MycF/NovP-related O-methyltransferase [Pseudogemmobacter humi]|uniref:Macrocin O-methyltransferase n=1 Tax=Pseudogemmobacter humi TaxID=2483812 RepID=A0A3P5XX07_9RHOB|nr:TylF/MycF/NovP-related O-methyltransferase [Pseudogemmobacter humi]VDC33709.1 Macrocin O-methyltransferase [Pseudogemmobacter humi]
MAPDPYIELLKKVISGHFHRENGMRINYLLNVAYGAQPFDLGKVLDIRSHASDALARIEADPDEASNYRERIFGFPYSMLGQKRLYNVEAALRIILHEKIPGDILEAGVWRGGACIFARMLLNHLAPDSDRLVWLCDSFEGLPPSEHEADKPHPFHLDLSLRCPLEQVRENFRLFGLDPDHKTRFVRGFFADTLPRLQTGGLSLLRADGDLYISTMDILENLYAQVVPGGFVIIDDYGALEPCRLATDEFRRRLGIRDPIRWIDWTGIYWRKGEAGG